MSLLSSRPRVSLPKEMIKTLTALWSLRFALNHDSASTIMTANWLGLIGDCVEWPLELLDQFHLENSKVANLLKSENNRGNKGKKTILWSAAFKYFEEAYLKQPEVLNVCFKKSIKMLEQHWLAKRDQDAVWKNISLLGEILQLNEFEQNVLLYFVSMECSRHLRMLFGEMDVESTLKASEMLACILDYSPQEVMDTLHHKRALISIGLVYKGRILEYFSDFLMISDSVKFALTYPNKDLSELMLHFTNQSTLGLLTVDDIPHLESSLHMLSNVMSNALSTKAIGVNILLYGASGTGKTEFAKLLAKQVGAILHEVGYTDNFGQAGSSRDRYVSLLMAQNFLSARDDTLLLFDEVEEVLTGSSTLGEDDPYIDIDRSRFSKAWVNHQLQNNPVPTIWICNDHRFIDQAYLRRFLFHLEFRIPPQSVRQQVAARYFKEFNLPEFTLRKLSQNVNLSPAQLENTARLLKLNGCHDQERKYY
jgi:hypothetical protein